MDQQTEYIPNQVINKSQILLHNIHKIIEHVPTKNSCGLMHPLSQISKDFIKYAASGTLPVVDLGCAYGLVSIKAAESGAIQVIACDMEEKHLRTLSEIATRLGLEAIITPKLGKFPTEISFSPDAIGAVLASLLLPYLTIDELDYGLQQIFKWLAPGGKLFISSYTIHIKEFANPTFEAEYQKRLNGNVKWPGYFEDFNLFSIMDTENKTTKSVPSTLHFFDLDPLVRALKEIGFAIETACYADGKLNGAIAETLYDGREMLSVVAIKPVNIPNNKKHESY